MGEPSEVIITIFGILDVTGEVVVMWIILALVAVLSLLVTRHLKERPGKFQNLIETGVEYLDNFFGGIMGKKTSRKYFYFLGSLFIFIIFANYSGLFPGVGLTIPSILLALRLASVNDSMNKARSDKTGKGDDSNG